MITLTYKPFKDDFPCDPAPVKELTMQLIDGISWVEATHEFHNFLRGAGYVIAHDLDVEEVEAILKEKNT